MLLGGSLTPSAANAATYYVAKTGSDNTSCSSVQSTFLVLLREKEKHFL